jgi:spermidine synthase
MTGIEGTGVPRFAGAVVDSKPSGPIDSGQLPLTLLLPLGSGIAALIYEIVWFQLLELTIGSTAVSLAVILATFMGGTCLGSLMFPRFVPSRTNPLRIYAAIEIGIGVFGILVLLLMPLAGNVYTAWTGYGLGGFLLRGILAAACLLPPTVLMGATLPALARRVTTTVPSTSNGVSWIGFFYGSNIAGAVLGCLLSGFYLLRVYDVVTATLFAAGLNVVVAVIAFRLASVATPVGDEDVWASQADPAPVPEIATTLAPDRATATTVYVVIAVSGFTALAAEAVWTRTLGLLFGASVYTFSIILAVFLFGLGLGSGIGSWLTRRPADPRVALGICQLLLSGAIAWTAYNVAASLPYWPIDPSISSNIWFNFQLDLARALWALLPPTLLWGASFPLALAALRSRDQDGARLFAGVYAANTVGAMAGALIASLLLVTWVGSQGTSQILIGLSATAALLILLPERLSSDITRARWARAGLAVIVLTLGLGLIVTVPPMSDLLIAHGRYAVTWEGTGDIIYAEEGLNSSVAVQSFPGGIRTFHVAGKIQASNAPRDMRLQRMLGHLTSLTSSNPRSVLVIGYGAGVTAGAVAIDPRVEQVTIVEIEPLVPEAASTYFSEHNLDVGSNDKVSVWIDDGRHYVQTTKERFDAITADPLDPWVKGAANLYTREFLDVVRQRLNPGGVVTMYMQLFETNLEAVKSSVATFSEVFPNATIWGNTYDGQGYDIVMLGQVDPLQIDLDEMEQRLARPDYAPLKASLEEVGLGSAVDLFATYAGQASDLGQWFLDAPINRDGNLRMQYLAGTALNMDDSPAIYRSILAYRRFPADLFTSEEGRVDSLREAIQGLPGSPRFPGRP